MAAKTSRKNALGRGLGALLEDSNTILPDGISSVPNSGAMSEVFLDQIQVNPFQPRTDFDRSALEELSESIKVQGIIQPITVRKLNDNEFQLIAGERRYQASKIAGLKTIPAYVRTADDQQMLEMALIENIQRENLNPIEEAEGYAILNSQHNLSHDDIAKTIGKKRTTVSNALRLLKLPPEIRKSIRNGKISAGHGRAILQKKSVPAMENLWKKIINDSLSVRAAEALVKPKLKTRVVKKIKIHKAPARAIENQLVEIFGTKVKLKPAQVGGSIEITYFSDDDLERIIDLLQSL